ncbi:MAG: enoyl-CoA hydratase/isomerase family protein [Alphaproteobacteria bacterium]|jgi:enoyl-CoA hydratase|nr:enoyl-CoA hydratase/isomerase family protein [Alphaproteobacteria bacterium]
MSIDLSRNGDFAVITINRPEALNALSFSLVRDISDRLDEVEGTDARGLIFIGAGDRAFCAGADIAELMGRSLVDHKADMERGQRTFDRLSTFRMPTLAVINGFAFGGGLELATACNLRVATPNAKMGLPEIKLGVIPGYGGTQRLPRLVGEGRAMDIVLSGRAVGAEEAERIGLVNRIIGEDGADPLEAGMAYLSEITQFGLPAIGLAREAVQRAMDTPVSEGLKIEADLNTIAFQTEDAIEGLTAFLEKRKPSFKDR